MSNSIYDIACQTFAKVFPKQAKKVKAIKELHLGYTNHSFLFSVKHDEKYQVRIPLAGDLIDRKCEYYCLKAVKDNNFVYFDKKTGIAVKKWIEGENPNKKTYKSQWFNDLLFEQISKLHNVKLPKSYKVKPINFDAYNKYLPYLKFEYQRKYLCLLDRRRNEPLVLTHSDINPLNIIYDGQKIHLIDYEWCCLASQYWDFANWIRETGISLDKIDMSGYIKNFDKEKLSDYVFLSSVFAHLWAQTMPPSRRILKYRKKTMKQIKKSYRYVIHHEKIYYN